MGRLSRSRSRGGSFYAVALIKCHLQNDTSLSDGWSTLLAIVQFKAAECRLDAVGCWQYFGKQPSENQFSGLLCGVR